MPTPRALRATRRGFLGLAGISAGLVAIGRLPLAAVHASAAPRDPAQGPRFFSERETEILTQIVERMIDTGEAAQPRVRDTHCIASIDALCRGLDPAVTQPLGPLLRVFDWAPYLLDFTWKRFTEMSDAEKDASLAAWMTSRIGLRRQAFYALRNLAFLGFWSQEESWPLAGYAGPLLRRAPSPAP
jgi:hypothetical protein